MPRYNVRITGSVDTPPQVGWEEVARIALVTLARDFLAHDEDVKELSESGWEILVADPMHPELEPLPGRPLLWEQTALWGDPEPYVSPDLTPYTDKEM